MQKRYKIRWSSDDRKKLTTAVRKFNAKRARLIKKDATYAEYLPEKASTVAIRKGIATRRDLINELNALNRFLRAGAEEKIVTSKGVKTTKYEKKEVGIRVRRVNRFRKKELESITPSTERGTMGTIRENNLRPKKYDIEKIRDKSNWKNYIEMVERQSRESYYIERDELYKENLLKAMRSEYGAKGRKLINLIKKIPANVLVDMYYYDSDLHIDFVYGLEEVDRRVKRMEEKIEEYFNKTNNNEGD